MDLIKLLSLKIELVILIQSTFKQLFEECAEWTYTFILIIIGKQNVRTLQIAWYSWQKPDVLDERRVTKNMFYGVLLLRI